MPVKELFLEKLGNLLASDLFESNLCQSINNLPVLIKVDLLSV